jgi:acyl carrier protein
MRPTASTAIQQEVVRVISKTKEVRPSRIRFTSRLSRDLRFDIVDVVDIILALEKTFKIEIPDEVPINTVGDFVNYVSDRLMKKGQFAG